MIAVNRTQRERQSKKILFVHGGPGMDSSYMRNVKFFDIEAECILYDQAPLKGEPIPRHIGAEESVAELLDQARLIKRTSSSLSLFAHSWGTYLAIEAAAHAPCLFQSIILCNPFALTWERAVAAGDRLLARVRPEHHSIIESLEADGSEQAGERLMNLVSYAYMGNRSDSVDLGTLRYNPRINGKVLESVRGFDQRPLVRPIASKVTCIYGAADYLLPSDSKELAMAGAKTEVIADCGHFPFAEAPSTLEALISTTLDR